jgi:PIN domain nuclease of toxin-antitoxin system
MGNGDPRYLLDTSTILWTLASSERLSQPARDIIANGWTVLSIVSYWEAILKAKKGQLAIGDPVSWWQRATKTLGLRRCLSAQITFRRSPVFPTIIAIRLTEC